MSPDLAVEVSTHAPTECLPRVSVVIPTKNASAVLRRAIDSVLAQDYPEIECIVADGGSTDDTQDILRDYGARIRWFSEPDRGAFDAINHGWQASTGSILAWLNADDVWEPGAASRAVSEFSADLDADVVYGDCGAIDANGRLFDVFPARPWDLHNAVKYADHIINQASSFMRRETVEKVGYLYPAWCHDHDLWLRIALAGGKFKAVSFRFASARVGPENLGSNPRVVIPGKLGVTRRFFASPDLPPEYRSLERRAISNTYLRCITYLDRSQRANWLLAGRLAARALAADPTNGPYVLTQLALGAAKGTPAARALRLAATLPPIATVPSALAASAAVAAALGGSVRMRVQTFGSVASPLLLLIAIRNLRRRG